MKKIGRESGMDNVTSNWKRISKWRNWSKQDTIFYGEREGGEGKEKPFNLTNRRFIRYLWVKSWEKAESDHTSLK